MDRIWVVYGLVALGVIIVLAVVMQVTDNLLQIEAKKRDVPQEGMGLYPRVRESFRRKLPAHLQGEVVHTLSKGYDIKLEGAATGVVQDITTTTRYAVQPTNWRGIAPIPKVLVEIGDSVLAGQPLFYDKQNSDVQFVAPVSGEVIEINRGAKRAITEVVVLADKENQFKKFEVPSLENASRDEIMSVLVDSGAWTLIKQRPYDVLAERGHSSR